MKSKKTKGVEDSDTWWRGRFTKLWYSEHEVEEMDDFISKVVEIERSKAQSELGHLYSQERVEAERAESWVEGVLDAKTKVYEQFNKVESILQTTPLDQIKFKFTERDCVNERKSGVIASLQAIAGLLAEGRPLSAEDNMSQS